MNTKFDEMLSNPCHSKWLILITLSLISIIFLLPSPLERQNLISNESLNPTKISVNFSTSPSPFKSLANALGLSNTLANIEYYDLHILNPKINHGVSYTLTFDGKDPLIPYFKNIINLTNLGIDGHPAIIIKPGDNYVISEIPTQINVVDNFGILSTCGVYGINDCPDITKENYEKGMKLALPFKLEIYATPSFIYWIAKLFLIFSFWLITITSIYGFLKIGQIL